MKYVFLIVGLIVFYGCSGDDKTEDPVFCTEELRAGLEVVVKDAINEIFLTDGVTVMAQDNGYTETLQNFTGLNTFVGAFERAGTYIIIVSKDGYRTSTSLPVVVGEDICHVITESIEIVLEKN